MAPEDGFLTAASRLKGDVWVGFQTNNSSTTKQASKLKQTNKNRLFLGFKIPKQLGFCINIPNKNEMKTSFLKIHEDFEWTFDISKIQISVTCSKWTGFRWFWCICGMSPSYFDIPRSSGLGRSRYHHWLRKGRQQGTFSYLFKTNKWSCDMVLLRRQFSRLKWTLLSPWCLLWAVLDVQIAVLSGKKQCGSWQPVGCGYAVNKGKEGLHRKKNGQIWLRTRVLSDVTWCLAKYLNTTIRCVKNLKLHLFWREAQLATSPTRCYNQQSLWQNNWTTSTQMEKFDLQ